MADPNVNIHKLSNGMTLVAESMPDVSSAAFAFLVPAGAAGDPVFSRCPQSMLGSAPSRTGFSIWTGRRIS